MLVKLQVGNYRYPVQLTLNNGRIEFQFRYNKALMEEIKCMTGAKWHGRDEKPRKVWSVLDCERNRFQLLWLQGENPYAWFERELQRHSYKRPLMSHQRDLADHGLTYHFQIWAAQPGLGKSLAAIEVMERSGYTDWWWCAPRAALKAVERELKKWQSRVSPTLLTYEGLVKTIKNWDQSRPPPHGVIFDESQRLKTATTHRSQAAFYLATMMRSAYGYDCYVIEMTGTPSPKSPVDWWHQAEIACPGFLREGSPAAFERRLAFMEQVMRPDGVQYWTKIGWRDDERKCEHCGRYEDFEGHDKLKATMMGLTYHPYKPSVNEVSLLYERLKGLVVIKSKKECLPELPDKHYRQIRCAPKPSTLRAAQTILRTAKNAITAMTLLRELSDGFQYAEEKTGVQQCGHCNGSGEVLQWVDREDEDRTFSQTDFLDPGIKDRLVQKKVVCPTCEGSGEVARYSRVAHQVPCPKAEVLRDLLEENEDQGRIVIFAGFTGAIDRCCEIAFKEKWSVIRVDGRGWSCFGPDGTLIKRDALDLWADMSDTEETRRVAFIAHPGSGGVGLTLTEASMAVFYSNDFNPENRAQAEDRIHRPGLDYAKGATIVDIIHLPSDDRVLEILRDNRRLELMTLGELGDILSPGGDAYDY
jgi:hypothetical protein